MSVFASRKIFGATSENWYVPGLTPEKTKYPAGFSVAVNVCLAFFKTKRTCSCLAPDAGVRSKAEMRRKDRNIRFRFIKKNTIKIEIRFYSRASILACFAAPPQAR